MNNAIYNFREPKNEPVLIISDREVRNESCLKKN